MLMRLKNETNIFNFMAGIFTDCDVEMVVKWDVDGEKTAHALCKF